MLPPPPAVAICELIADHAATAVDQRAARVARVDRRVGLDHVLDREAVGSLDLPLERAHDSRRDGAVEAERVSDRDHRVADPHVRGVAQCQRLERLLVGVDLEQRDVRGGVTADDLGVVGLVVQVDRHLRGALDDVGVGDDVAAVVDHEAGSRRRPSLALRKEIEGRLRSLNHLRAHECDARPVLLVDLMDAHAGTSLRVGHRGLVDRALDDGGLLVATDHAREGEDQHGHNHDRTAQQRRHEGVLGCPAESLA